MDIDKNPLECKAMEAFRNGEQETGFMLQDEFVAQLRESIKSQDHCPCKKSACKYHGNCLECVAIHRAHQEHLPVCFRDMVNERIQQLSTLTEDTAFAGNR